MGWVRGAGVVEGEIEGQCSCDRDLTDSTEL